MKLRGAEIDGGGAPHLLSALDDIAKVQHVSGSHKLHAVGTETTLLALSSAGLAARRISGNPCQATNRTPPCCCL